MSKYIIYGGKKLKGTINVPTSKNATLPILAGSILAKNEVVLKNLPQFKDVLKMEKILKHLGCKIKKENNKTIINTEELNTCFIPNNLTNEIRSSIFMLGPMLAKFKKARISFPGGCNIGIRPIDLHIKGLKALNVKIFEEHGYLNCDASFMKGADIHLDFPSVGATENLMMASLSAKGKTRIFNPAKEPEIIDLQNFLVKMGAKISGAGTNVITVYETNLNNLKHICYTPIPDRIISGTYLIAGAITGGNITLNNCIPAHFNTLTDILIKTGCKITTFKNKVHLISPKKLKSFGKIETMPYPGFATDLQSQLTTLASILNGVSIVKENIFECRFRYVPELIKMGANINVNNNIAVVEGKNELLGADVFATDLRGGVSLVLAGLNAKGYTTVNEIEFIERGYFNLEKDLQSLGADIKKVE